MKTGWPIAVLKSKISSFYLLAFLPLVLIVYYMYVSGSKVLSIVIPFYGSVSNSTVLSVVIPFYAFLLLFLKKDRLFLYSDPVKLQRFVGLAVMFASFFVFYVMIGFYSFALDGAVAAFYTIYIFGLFLIFFSVRALNESVSAFFLVIAGGSSFYAGKWLEYYTEPLVPYFVPFFVFVLRMLGISATIQNPPTLILLNTPKGPIPVLFAAACMGIYSFLAVSIIAVITMMEVSASRRTKLIWAIGGVIGTFFINTLRVSLIGLVIYYFGYERWQVVHAWIGYALVLLWLTFLFVTFSKREVILNKIQVLWKKFCCILF